MSKIETILVIGYGSMGRRRIRLTGDIITNARFICVDSNINRMEQARKDGYMALTSVDEGLEMSPKIAFVCTSPGHHADIILQLLNAGVHVFAELNLVSDKYDIIRKTAEEQNRIVFISSTLIYKRQMEYFKRIVSSQIKPIVYSYHVGQYLPDWHPWESYKDFFIGKKQTNGVREIMAIQLPWIINTFGRINDVKVSHQRCTGLDIDFPDTVLLLIEHENGNMGSFLIDVTSRKAVTRLEIVGEDVHVFWDGHNDDLFKYNVETKELEQVVVYESEEHIDGYSDNIAEEPYRDEIREFLRAIDGNKVRYGLDEDDYVLNIIDRIEQEY